ncbi:1-deoxy-D-xylulose-5-phosphate reductoisomerase [Candidatus Williamhamiltonella defendens]|uniref:1-deoxy-D-xylulose 5-phosphate reductoisomerase n=1 Tax=Candidatus Williamhamiltonella defendens TaxID=138072 RepID=A0A2D3TDV6_9ENTR|nr:1-deoxy-D-xylulose-5-phosphate reductoisomerase [Candidatus Hamiltonella defensa]ATW33958.1 1-deoxy-D-xylulose-5-phosphate reductoisomerase [Candidatus Hamiltonella defensa]
MKQLAILGSTGSIGCSTLAVVRTNPHLFSVTALVASSNVQRMAKQCEEFHPRYASMSNEKLAQELRLLLAKKNIKTEVFSGSKAACELAMLTEVDQVMAAIVGVAGLTPTLAAIRAGKKVLLANKESLITCGRIFMNAVKKYGAQLLPIDSEHNAIFQSLPQKIQRELGNLSLSENGVSSIILTGSGGSLRDIPLEEFSRITPEKACAHPNWSMGKKISVDSATMMNKGLEYIEARWLFNASDQQIEILLHPQSVIHSMVCYKDGSILAQLGAPDMRTPIAHAMAYPERINSGSPSLDFYSMNALTFSKPDPARYPCLQLAIHAFKSGQSATTILNAANEVAVEAFLNTKIRFTDIAMINQKVLDQLSLPEPKDVQEVLDIDRQARQKAEKILLA